MTAPTSQAAAASGDSPRTPGRRSGQDRLDKMLSDVQHDLRLTRVDVEDLLKLAVCYRDSDDRAALAYLQRLLGEDADPDDGSWAERVADTTRRAQ